MYLRKSLYSSTAFRRSESRHAHAMVSGGVIIPHKREERLLLAVLVDADNVPARHAGAILREISGIGDPALRRVYGDWNSPLLTGWLEKTRTLGMVACQQTVNVSRKNTSDIGLVIDAMDILHGDVSYDGFVIVSSDSDFTKLASRLREGGRLVIGIGEAKTPAALRNVCNQFIMIENIAAQDVAHGGGAKIEKGREPAVKAESIVHAAIQKIDEEWCKLGAVGLKIRALYPDFDTRTYGAEKLGELVKRLSAIEIRRRNDHPEIRWVRPAGPDPK